MRIAMLAYRGTMRSGGLGIYIRDLTRQLAKQGCQVDVFVGPPYPDPMPWLHEIRLPNESYWARRFTASWAAPLSEAGPFQIFGPLNFFELAATRFGFLPEPFAFSLRAAHRLVGCMRAGERYDVVHDVQTLGYGLLLLRALGLPAVSTVHHPLTIDRRSSLRRDRSFTDMKGTLTFYPVRTQARVARRIDAVITSSEASIGEIESGFGVRRERIHNVLNGVELPASGRVRPRPAAPELLFIGRAYDPNKGFVDLLTALTQLPPEVTLRVLDIPPETKTAIARQLAEQQLASRVVFAGKIPRPDLEHALAHATAVVVPSLFEGFGLPAVEALAAGTPVIATRAGALPEVIARAGAGTLVQPGDPADLARGIAHTLSHWETLQRAAVAARPRIESTFGWAEVAARTREVYTEVLRRRGR